MSAVQAPHRSPAVPAGQRREQFAAFVRLGRPRFLVESLLTVALGLAVAVHEGARLDLSQYLLVQAFVTGTHTMTHYCNEYFDREADAAQQAPTSWTGGSRVLAHGRLDPEVSLAGAFVFLFAMSGLVAAMPDTGSRLAGVAVLALAWFYTAPPLRLNYRGAGEVTTAGVLLLLTPGLTCYLQTRTVPALLVAVTVPLCVVMAARMVVMNLCDHDADRTVGKITIPGLIGPRRAALLYTAAQAGAYGSVLVMTVLDVLPLAVGIAILATAPAGIWMARRLLTEPIGTPEYADTTALTATLHAAATGYAATVGVIAANLAPGDADVGPGTSVAASAGLLVLYTLLQAAVQLGGRRGTPTDEEAHA